MPELQQLIKDYQTRLQQHESERADTAARLRAIAISQGELEIMQQTIDAKDAKIAKLEHRLCHQDAEVCTLYTDLPSLLALSRSRRWAST